MFMTNNTFFRHAGWCAVIVALLLLAIHVVPSGPASLVGLILTIATLLGLTFVFYALFVAHRPASPTLSQAGLALWYLVLALNLVGLAGSLGVVLGHVDALLRPFPVLVFAFLAFRSDRMPRSLAVAAFLGGISLFITAFAGMLATRAAADAASLLADVFLLVWLIKLGFVFVSDEFSTPKIRTGRSLDRQVDC
jgi:hypothetical protein